MKLLFILLLVLAGTNSFGQVKNSKPGISVKEQNPKRDSVVHAERIEPERQPAFGQITNIKLPSISVTGASPKRDTTLRVIHVDRNKPERQAAFVVNGKHLVSQSFIRSFDPRQIADIKVAKGDTLINNVQYNGIIRITTKGEYNPTAISLTGVKNKYTEYQGKPVIFMIDGNIVNADYDTYLIDENDLLTITVDKFQNAKESTGMGLIKLLTKSEENIKKRGQIIIRGSELTYNK